MLGSREIEEGSKEHRRQGHRSSATLEEADRLELG